MEPDIVLFYFSGTGSTRWACGRFREGAALLGHRVDLVPIDRWDGAALAAAAAAIAAARLVGFAYPVYGAAPPPIMDAFLAALEAERGGTAASPAPTPPEAPRGPKPAFILSTVGYVNAYGPYLAARRLRRLGLDLVGHIVCRLADSTKAPDAAQGAMPASRLARRKDKAGRQIDRLLARLEMVRPLVGGIGPWLLGGPLVRRALAGPIRAQYRNWVVDPAACTRCLRCVRDCPTGAIAFDARGLVFSPACTACMRCRNACPEGAIRLRGEMKRDARKS